MWKIEYKPSVQKDLKKISINIQRLIKRSIEDKLSTDPVRFGTPLRRDLRGRFKLRVGDYRIIYSINRQTVIVLVIKIGHRKEVYKIKN